MYLTVAVVLFYFKYMYIMMMTAMFYINDQVTVINYDASAESRAESRRELHDIRLKSRPDQMEMFN